MSTLARLDVTRLELVPGGEASCRLSITNNSQIVEAYRFTPLGDLAPYTTVEPPELSLYPGTDGEVTISFTVPRNTSVTAAELPFAVMVQPSENPNDTAVPECIVDVAGFIQTDRELSPRMSQAHWRTTHSLAVDNRGNHPIRVFLRGEDADDQLRIRCKPDVLVIDPGNAEFAKIKIRTSRIMWRGSPQTLPFRVLMSVNDAPASALDDFAAGSAGRPDEGGPLPGTPATPADGQVVQGPVFPRGIGKVMALAAVALIALAALWYGLMRPTVRSAAQQAATEAVTEQVAAVEQKAEQAQQQAAAAQQQAAAAGQQAVQASGAAKQASTAVDDDQAARALAEAVAPFNRRIVVAAAPGQDEVGDYVVPDGQVVTVTDLVFESRGDIGGVRLLRDGDVLMTARMQNYRTLDQHFVSPIIFTEGQRIVYEVQCVTPVQNQPECEAGLYISGTVQPEQPPPPPPPPGAPLPPADAPESGAPPQPGGDQPDSGDQQPDSGDQPGSGSQPDSVAPADGE